MHERLFGVWKRRLHNVGEQKIYCSERRFANGDNFGSKLFYVFANCQRPETTPIPASSAFGVTKVFLIEIFHLFFIEFNSFLIQNFYFIL